jgi:hypothetical protein
MKSLPRAWWTVVVLTGVFTVGVLFDRYALPFLTRDVWVWVIPVVAGRGCEGPTVTTWFRFGNPVDWAHGVYKIPCHDLGSATETAALHCDCGAPL